MEGMRFTQNRQNTRSFGKFLAGNPTRPPAPVAAVFRFEKIGMEMRSRSETCSSVLFESEIPCIL